LGVLVERRAALLLKHLEVVFQNGLALGLVDLIFAHNAISMTGRSASSESSSRCSGVSESRRRHGEVQKQSCCARLRAMPRRPPVRELPALDADMRPDDLVDELQRLKFDSGNNEFNAIKIDADVRDFLVAALSARHATRRT